jgi:hypothetical protein
MADEWTIGDPEDPKVAPAPIYVPTPDPPASPAEPVNVPDFPPIELDD